MQYTNDFKLQYVQSAHNKQQAALPEQDPRSHNGENTTDR